MKKKEIRYCKMDDLSALNDLVHTIETIHNINTSQTERHKAYQACEDFKENSELCPKYGSLLADKKFPSTVRHFGLQVLEHCVKFRWNRMAPQDKVTLKNNTMLLLKEGTHDILTESAAVKDALSKIVVEMIKREWPQHWPELLNELSELCKLGVTQTELVLFIFLRLAEDIVVLQTMPNPQRRKEILATMTQNMSEIFNFFLDTLDSNYAAYIKLKEADSPEAKRELEMHTKICTSVMETLTGYLDWVNTSLIMERGGRLLQMLCIMLHDVRLQLYAAECLLIITNRKGKVESRTDLLILFSADAMNSIFTAAISASKADLSEYHYLFLKKLCQVLTNLGTQLCSLWGTVPEVKKPETFDKYLEAILAFTQHPSQTLGSYTQALWASFLRHEFISKCPDFVEFFPKVIATTKITLLKVGYLTQNNSPSCDYARLDFDSNEEFHMFFCKYRSLVSAFIRNSTLLFPLVTFSFGAQWLESQLAKPVEPCNGDKEHCGYQSDLFLEWDALACYLESAVSRLGQSDQEQATVQEGVRLLNCVLTYQTNDPLILSCLMSCISALFLFIKHAPEVLPCVLSKIFSTAVFQCDGQTKATRSRAVRNVRRHACSVLIKTCKQYPNLLLPGFDQLYNHIKQLSSDPEELSQMEKITQMEGLILISNEFKNYEKQANFIGEIITPVRELWLSDDLKSSLWSADSFMTYVGLNQPPVEPSSADTSGINRSHIISCVNTILAILKRSERLSTTGDSAGVAQAGGFIFNTPGGKAVCRNPATSFVLPLFDNVLALVRTLNILLTPEYLAKRHPDFAEVFDISVAERQTILGIVPPMLLDGEKEPPSYTKPMCRMQSFFTNVHDNSYHLLGNAGIALGEDFYQSPNLATSLINSVFINIDAVSDARLKVVIRAFLKPYVQNCPPEYYETAVIPLLAVLCPFMHQKLGAKWQIINQRTESGEIEDYAPESEEIFQDQLSRNLTREYIELLGIALREKKGAHSHGDEEGDDENQHQTKEVVTKEDESLGDLGKRIFKSEGAFVPIAMTLFGGLGWSDMPTCTRCLHLCWPVLKEMLSNNSLGAPDSCHIFTSVLQGLQINGQHEATPLLSFACHTYHKLRERFAEVRDVMLQVPSCNKQGLDNFDDKLLNTSPTKQIPERHKRDMFKRLISDCIGKTLGEQFKKEVHIANLPRLFRQPKKRAPTLDDIDPNAMGICALFSPDHGDE